MKISRETETLFNIQGMTLNLTSSSGFLLTLKMSKNNLDELKVKVSEQ